MRLTPYQTCPGLDLAWAGPLCLSALARRYVVEPESVKQAAEAMGLAEVRPCHALLGNAHYRAFMDRALIADFDFQSRLRVLTDEESEMLFAAIAREKQRGRSRRYMDRQRAKPEKREQLLRRTSEWAAANRDRKNGYMKRWRVLNPAKAAALNAARRQRAAERKGRQA